MNLPKTLQEKRDELAREFNSKEYGSKIDFKKGFNSACNLLLPEIEKLLATLREIDCDTNSKHWAKATDAIESWQRFADGGE